MSDPPNDTEVETPLRDFLHSPEAAPQAVRAAAKALFELRRTEDVLAEWSSESLTAVRGGWRAEESDSLEFHTGPDLHISLGLARGRLAGSISPIPQALSVEDSSGDRIPVSIDEAGGFSARVVGAVRLRVERVGEPDVVTDMVIVPA